MRRASEMNGSSAVLRCARRSSSSSGHAFTASSSSAVASAPSCAPRFTGWSPPERGGQFGIVSYDWSTAKLQWAAAKPMDCEERLQTQARMTKAFNPASHIFV